MHNPITLRPPGLKRLGAERRRKSHALAGGEHPDHADRIRHAVRRPPAVLLAAGRAGRGAARDQADDPGAPSRRRSRPLPDDNGSYTLIGRYCAHRGADLAYGRLENGGVRCLYHGWLYTADGRCLEQPAEPEHSRFHEKIRHTSYPCLERNGIVFAVPRRRRATPFPDYDCFVAPGRLHVRVQGPVGLQLAAGRRGRHRPEPRLVPPPVPRRGPARRVRPAVRARRSRAPTRRSPSSSVTTSAPTSRSRGRTTGCASTPSASSTRRPTRPDHEPDVPERLRRPVRRHEGLRAVARPDRRREPLLVHDPLRLRGADRQGRRFAPTSRLVHPPRLPAGPEPRQQLGLRHRRAAVADLHGHGARHQRARPVGGRGAGAIQDRTEERLGVSDRAITANRRMLLRAIADHQAGNGHAGLPTSEASARELRGPLAIDLIAPADEWQATGAGGGAAPAGLVAWGGESGAQSAGLIEAAPRGTAMAVRDAAGRLNRSSSSSATGSGPTRSSPPRCRCSGSSTSTASTSFASPSRTSTGSSAARR